jgi:tetratricopeptide (TPR) repeat protein
MKREESDLDEKLGRILRRRQERLGVSREEAGQPPGEPPLFLQAARDRAARFGCDLDDLLRHDLQQMRDSPYPGPDCLQPDEVMAYVEARELPPARLAHAETCPECRTLIATASQPPRLPREVPAPEASRQRAMPSVFSPALAAAALVLALGLFPWIKTRLSLGPIRVASASIVVLSADVADVRGPGSLGVGTSWLNAACAQQITSMLNRRAADHKLRVEAWDRSAELSLAIAGRGLGDPVDLQMLQRGFGAGSFVRCSGRVERSGLILSVEVEREGKLQEASFRAEGEPSGKISALAMDAGRWVIEKLGIGEAPVEEPTRYAMPMKAGAVRPFSQGLANLANNRPSEAAKLLGDAVDHEKHPLAFAALSRAWSQLGDSNRERQYALEAFQAADRYSLPKYEKLALEARHSEANADWKSAVKLYSRLEKISPDPVDSAIHVAEAHLATSDARSALAKVEELREGSVSTLDSARLDLLEARAADILSEPNRQRQAALRAAAIGQRLGARRVEAEALLMAGRAARTQEDLDDAGKHFERAQRLFDEIGDANGSAAVLHEQGVSAWRISHDAKTAESLLRQALDRYQKLGNRGAAASVQIKLGHVDDDLHHRPDAALAHYEAALRTFDELGNEQGIAQARLSQGIALWRGFGKFAEAEEIFEDALKGFQSISDRSGEARVLNNHGQLLFELGQIGDAQEVLEQSLILRKETGLRRDEAASHAALAEVLVYEDELSEAEEHYETALAIYDDIYKDMGRESPEAAWIRLRRAALWLEQGRLAEAEAELRDLLALAPNLKMGPDPRAVELVLAQMLLLQKKPGEARALLRPTDGNEAPSDELVLLTARIEIAEGRGADAAEKLRPILDRAIDKRLVLVELEARLALGEAYLALDRKDAAQEQLRMVRSRSADTGAHLLSRKAAALLGSDRQPFSASSLFSFFL